MKGDKAQPGTLLKISNMWIIEGIGSELKHINEVGFSEMRKKKKYLSLNDNEKSHSQKSGKLNYSQPPITAQPNLECETPNNLHPGRVKKETFFLVLFEGFFLRCRWGWRHWKSAKKKRNENVKMAGKECKEENKTRININMSTIN